MHRVCSLQPHYTYLACIGGPITVYVHAWRGVKWSSVSPSIILSLYSTCSLRHGHLSLRYDRSSLGGRFGHAHNICIACRSTCNCDHCPWMLNFEALDHLTSWEFKGQKQPHLLVSEKVHWSVDIGCVLIPWSAPKKNIDRLIVWFHFDHSRKSFYRQHVRDYPMQTLGNWQNQIGS